MMRRIPRGVIPVCGFSEISLRDAVGGWIVAAPSVSAPYAPVQQEFVFQPNDLPNAVALFVGRVAQNEIDSIGHLVSTMPTGDSPLLNASERAVLGLRVSNGYIITFYQRPKEEEIEEPSKRKAVWTRLFEDDGPQKPEVVIEKFFREGMEKP